MLLLLILFIHRWTDPNPLQAITLGMLARCVAGGMMLPVTVVKTRYEVSHHILLVT